MANPGGGPDPLRWQCRRPNCGAIYVGADAPEEGHGCPSSDELAARRGERFPATHGDCLRAPCATPALCTRADRCAIRMNQEIESDPFALDVIAFLTRAGDLAGPGRVVAPGVAASRPRVLASAPKRTAIYVDVGEALCRGCAEKFLIPYDVPPGPVAPCVVCEEPTGARCGAPPPRSYVDVGEALVSRVRRVIPYDVPPGPVAPCVVCEKPTGARCGAPPPRSGAVAAAGRDAKGAAGVAGRVAAADSGAGRPAGIASPADVGGGAEGAPGLSAAGPHGAEERLSPGRDADARGIPIATVAAVHLERIAATLRVAGVCSCTACVCFAVAHEPDVLPMLAPAIAGRFAPGHGPAPDQEPKKRDRGVSHPASVRPRRRGKK